MCADFKGHFTVGNGKRCDPLTITDAHSRFLLGCQILRKTDGESTRRVFERVFKEYGCHWLSKQITEVRLHQGPLED